MADIGYYTLPVIPSFKGIEKATQDQLDKAFKDSGQRTGKAHADEHEKAFRKATVDNTKNRQSDSATNEAIKKQGQDSGKKAGEAHNEAFKKATTGDKAATESAGKVIGQALGRGAGQAAGEALNDVLKDTLPDALKGLAPSLSGLGASAGEALGGAVGDNIGKIPHIIADAFHQAKATIDASSVDIKGSLGSIKGAADLAHTGVGAIGDGLHKAAEGIRGMTAGGAIDGLGRVSGILSTAEPLAKAFGVDVSGWTGPLGDAATKITDVTAGVKGFATFIEADAPLIAAALDTALGPIAIAVGAALLLKQYIEAIGRQEAQNAKDFNDMMGDPRRRQAALAPDLPRQQAGITPPAAGQPLAPLTATDKTALAHLAAGGDKEALAVLQMRAQNGDTEAANLLKSMGKAAGGPITGPGAKGRDSVLMYGAVGEHIWTADEVDKAGGHGAVYAMRQAVRGYQTGGAVNPPALEAYVDSMIGTPYNNNTRTDCSGMASRIASVYLGMAPNAVFTTSSEEAWLRSHGAIMGMGPPGTLRIGWYNHGSGTMDGHTAVTLPDGRNAEAGGSHGRFLVGAGAAGADNAEFDHHAYFPPNPQGPDSGGGTGGLLGTAGRGGPGGAAGGPLGTAGGGTAAGGGPAGGAGMVGVRGATGGGGGTGGGGPEDALSGLAPIGKQFLADTFGFGTILPDLDKIPGIGFGLAMLGSLGNKLKQSKEPGQRAAGSLLSGLGGGGGTGGALGNLFGNMIPVGGTTTNPTPGTVAGPANGNGMMGVSDPSGSMAASAFGMIPDAVGAARQAGILPPVTPGADMFTPGGGPQPGAAPAGNVDNSLHVNVSGVSPEEVATKVTRQVQWAPRVATNTPPGHA